jgi:hypothetical protein
VYHEVGSVYGCPRRARVAQIVILGPDDANARVHRLKLAYHGYTDESGAAGDDHRSPLPEASTRLAHSTEG